MDSSRVALPQSTTRTHHRQGPMSRIFRANQYPRPNNRSSSRHNLYHTGGQRMSALPQMLSPRLDASFFHTFLAVQDESPFDNVLRTDDLSRAKDMVSYIGFREKYPPRLTLEDFIRGKKGNEGFSETLLLLISSGIYRVTAAFLEHVIVHFNEKNILMVLDSLPDLNDTDTKISGPHGKVLHLAVRKRYIDVAKKLVSLGFTINERDDMNQTPIFYFIQGDEFNSVRDVVAFLPANGGGCVEGVTLPHYVEGGANDVDAINHHGQSKWLNFDHATDNFSFDQTMWNFLMEMKGDLNVTDKFGDTPLSLAVKLHRDEVVLRLIKNVDVKIELSEDNNPPFHIYCDEGILKPAVFQAFAARVIANRMINYLNYEGKTALHCLLNNPLGQENPSLLKPFIERFVDSRIDLSIQDALGDTPLMMAVDRGFPIDILILLTSKDNPLFLYLKNKAGFNVLTLSLLKFKGEKNNPLELPLNSELRHPGLSENHLSSSQLQIQGDSECALQYFIHCLLKLIPKTVDHHMFVTRGSGTRRLALMSEEAVRGTHEDCEKDTIMTRIIQNKYITFKTWKLLLATPLVDISSHVLRPCLLHFRLDILDEIISTACLRSRHDPLFQMICQRKELAINIIDHVYSFRHVYSSARSSFLNGSKTVGRSSSPPSLNGTTVIPLSRVACNGAINEDQGIPDVTRKLAMENLSRIKPMLSRLFEIFGHDVNHIIKQKDPHTNEWIQAFTLIHALIQAHSWVPMHDVWIYILGDMRDKVDINVHLQGRGTPLNYAIRLGEFELADKFLDMNASVKDLDLKIPVLPLKRGFSKTMRKIKEKGVNIPPEFGQQVKSRIDDPDLRDEFHHFLKETRNSSSCRISQNGLSRHYSDHYVYPRRHGH